MEFMNGAFALESNFSYGGICSCSFQLFAGSRVNTGFSLDVCLLVAQQISIKCYAATVQDK